MQNNYPVVTAFSLVYNTGIHVIQALESIRANNYPNLEHIIIDDCSSDGESTQLVEQWINDNNYPCIFIKHEANQGVCRTLNEILSIAKGKYIFGCSDDMIMPERIKTQVDLLEKADNDVCAVYSKVYIWQKGKVHYDWLLGGNSDDISPEGYILNDLIVRNFIPAMGIMVKTECLKEVGGYNESYLYEDYPMWLKLAERFKFLYSEYVSAIYKLNSESLTTQINNWDIGYLKMYSELKDQSNKVLHRRYLDIAYKAYWSNNAESLIYMRKNLKHLKIPGLGFVLGVSRFPFSKKIGKGLIKFFTPL